MSKLEFKIIMINLCGSPMCSIMKKRKFFLFLIYEIRKKEIFFCLFEITLGKPLEGKIIINLNTK